MRIHSMARPVTFLAAGLILSAALAGCACDKAGASGESTKSTAINTVCPIGGHDAEATIVRTWKGQNIAFCCDGCTAKWDKMADAQKDEILTLAQANKTK